MPISPNLKVPPGRSFDFVREALASIDSVHGDGELPTTPVTMGRGRQERGGYSFGRQGRAIALRVSRYSDEPHLTTVHEVGHFLDHQALGAPGHFASETGRLTDIMRAIEASEAIRVLRSLGGRRRAVLASPDGRRQLHAIRQDYLSYLLQPREVFARAYAQYIAISSREERLLLELGRIRASLLNRQVYHVQWTDDDFEPIASAVGQLLRRMRWVQ